jgi:hypothetical protein
VYLPNNYITIPIFKSLFQDDKLFYTLEYIYQEIYHQGITMKIWEMQTKTTLKLDFWFKNWLSNSKKNKLQPFS